jgi:DNA gyrase/topoisomerase IV subunit B
VEIDVEYNRICGYNNGDGVPIKIHKEGVYVLEMIFDHISSPTIITMM